MDGKREREQRCNFGLMNEGKILLSFFSSSAELNSVPLNYLVKWMKKER